MKPSFALLLGCLLGLCLLGETVSAEGPPDAEDTGQEPTISYAHSITDYFATYSSPQDSEAGLPPARAFEPGFVWVTLDDSPPILYKGINWYRTLQGDYANAYQIAAFEPSKFQGAVFVTPPDKPFGWLVSNAAVSSAPGKAPAKDAPRLERYSMVIIYEEQKVGDWNWYLVGDNQWIEQRRVGVVLASPRPETIPPEDKWIEVNLYEQTLAAYEGDRLVYATLVSSGLPRWSTPTGLFQVWVKATKNKMSGADGRADYYWLDDVPWILYFKGDVALHGAYWHDAFGLPHSHGCVNLAPNDARWLFDWATPATGPGKWTLSTPEDPGTWVWVH